MQVGDFVQWFFLSSPTGLRLNASHSPWDTLCKSSAYVETGGFYGRTQNDLWRPPSRECDKEAHLVLPQGLPCPRACLAPGPWTRRNQTCY